MSSQLVDLDADGHNDILAGSFSGVPQWIRGAAEGFGEAQPITDRSGQTVLIAAFWNEAARKWDETDRAHSKGHCTSVAAVDWDADGDLDLILGDYYGGRMFLRLNEGHAGSPRFALANQALEAGGSPMVIEGGLSAPRIADWDGDGRFDILCGGSRGGVYLFRNVGQEASPRFLAAVTLIEPLKDPSESYVTRVPTRDGQPAMPGSSYHIEPTDLDGDGDLDLLVGARSSWLKDNPLVLTDQQRKEAEQVERRYRDVQRRFREAARQAKTDEQRAALVRSEDYIKLVDELVALQAEQKKYDADPVESGDFVWFFRRK